MLMYINIFKSYSILQYITVYELYEYTVDTVSQVSESQIQYYTG